MNNARRTKKDNKIEKVNRKTVMIIISIIVILSVVCLCFASNFGVNQMISETIDGTVYNMGGFADVYYSSLYVKNLSFRGTLSDANSLEEVLARDKKMYSNENYTFSNISKKYDNFEYLKTSSVDNERVLSNLITFTAKKDITILVIRDERTDAPSWLDSTYNRTDDDFVAGNGVTYSIYTKNVTEGTEVTIGSTSDTLEGGQKGEATIIGFKETSLVENGIFFEDDFSKVDADSITFGYNGVAEADTEIIADAETFSYDSEHKEVLHFVDNNVQSGSNNLAFIEKEFASINTDFNFKFDIFIPNNTYNNKYIRTFFDSEMLPDSSSKLYMAIQAYIHKEDTNLESIICKNYNNRDVYLTGKGSYPVGEWHTYEYCVDFDNKTFKTLIDGNDTGVEGSFFSTQSLVKYFVIGTGQARTSDFYLDNINITPRPTEVITGITIDGNKLNGFSSSTLEYQYADTLLEAGTDIQVTGNEYYASYTTEYVAATDSTYPKYIVTVKDIYNNEINYTISNNKKLESLEGFTIVNSNGGTLKAQEVEYNGKTAIKLTDDVEGTNDSDLIYMYKKFNSQEELFNFSYDISIPNNDIANEMNTIQLSEGIPSTFSDKTGVGIETYLKKQQNTEQDIYISSRQGAGNDSTLDYTYTNSPMTINEWHNIKYKVNVKIKTYDIYIDNELVASNVAFKSGFNGNSMDTMLFATSANYKSEIYIANVKVEEIVGYPIDGIKVDGVAISGFLHDKFNYNFYSEIEMDSTYPTVTVTENSNYKNVSYKRDIENQTITITATNTLGVNYEYVVTVKNLLDRTVTKTQLQALIDQCYIDYPDENKSIYVEKGWDNLRKVLTQGQELIDSGNAKTSELAMSYYSIEQALTKLIKYKDYAYDSGIIEVVRYSEDLENLFTIEEVLENGANIYNDSDETFYSVPYKIWNAEYLKISKTAQTGVGALQFRAMIPVDVFIGYDREGGVLYADGFSDTGDIITSSDGTVYKVYKKHYKTGDIITLDFDLCIANQISGKNSIVAVIDSTQSNNDVFCSSSEAGMSNERLKKIWTVEAGVGSDVEIVTHNGEEVLRLESTSTKNMAYLYKRFAKLSDKIEFSFSILNPGKLTDAEDNRWTRTWLTKGTPVMPTSTSDQTDKLNIMMEAYIDNEAKYQNDQVRISSKFFSSTKFDFDTWNTIIYTFDIKNKKATVTKKGTNKVEDVSSSLINNLSYADHVLFSTRLNGSTWVNLKDATVKPITRDIITDITVDGTSIGLYYPLTKDYLYKYDKIEDKDPSNIVDVNKGSVYGDTSVINQKEASTKYATINLVDSSDGYTFENRVYFELNVDKSKLTEIIYEAQNMDKYLYTVPSWDIMLNAVDAGIVTLKDLNATQMEVDAQVAAIQQAIDSLVLKTDAEASIKAEMYYGKNFDFSAPQEQIDMTNDSSVTIVTTVEKSNKNIYADTETIMDRKITTSVSLPVNTKITVMDTSTSDVQYYYYIVTENDFSLDRKDYSLFEFTKMGTTNEKFNRALNYDISKERIYEKYTFILDYADVAAENKLQTSSYDFTYTLVTHVSEISMDRIAIKNVEYNMYSAKKTNVLSTIPVDSVYALQGDPIKFNLTNIYKSITDSTVIVKDTTIDDQKMGIVLTLYDENDNKLAFPTGVSAKIQYDENDSSKMSESILNSDGQLFIKYQDTIFSVIKGRELTISPAYENILESGKYKIKLELFQSYDGINYGKIMSDKTINIELADNAGYGLKAELTNVANPIIDQGESFVLPVQIDRSVANTDIKLEDLRTSVKLLKKDDITGEYVELDIDDYVTNTELGPITTSRKDYLIDLGSQNKVIANLRFLDTLEKGTYRLEFKLYNNVDLTKQLADDVENFIIK